MINYPQESVQYVTLLPPSEETRTCTATINPVYLSRTRLEVISAPHDIYLTLTNATTVTATRRSLPSLRWYQLTARWQRWLASRRQIQFAVREFKYPGY